MPDQLAIQRFKKEYADYDKFRLCKIMTESAAQSDMHVAASELLEETLKQEDIAWKKTQRAERLAAIPWKKILFLVLFYGLIAAKIITHVMTWRR
jgi:hypothetical protein